MQYIALILVSLAMIIPGVGAAASSDDYIYVDDVTMHLQGDNATFDLNYSLETFTRFYVLALGCRYLEPELLSLLGNYSDVRLIKADVNGASLEVKDAGKYNSGYYLFDSRPFGSRDKPLKETIPKFSVIYPEGRTRTFYNVTATENVFCRAGALAGHIDF
ncbi:Uncharacterised protein [uncultured archaeon]|nr:Uncharacterised protein [uncultured archaeon]